LEKLRFDKINKNPVGVDGGGGDLRVRGNILASSITAAATLRVVRDSVCVFVRMRGVVAITSKT
jgi:hypothetical protein